MFFPYMDQLFFIKTALEQHANATKWWKTLWFFLSITMFQKHLKASNEIKIVLYVNITVSQTLPSRSAGRASSLMCPSAVP